MGQENRDILNFLISQGLADVEVTGGTGATTLPIDRRLRVVRWRARPATRNRHGGRECDRVRPGRTRPSLFESDLSAACRRGGVRRGDGGLL